MREDITDENLIALICNGEFDAIRDFKIGELFESFFDNINYNVVRDEENKDVYVDFTGEAICDNEPCAILIRFKVNDNAEEFRIDSVKVDDTFLNEEEIYDLLDDIAFAGGAVLDDDDYCYNCDAEGCESCIHNNQKALDELENEEDGDDEIEKDDIDNSKKNDNDKEDDDE